LLAQIALFHKAFLAGVKGEISIDIYMVLKALDLSLDRLNMTIEGYGDIAQLIPVNAYHRLIHLWWNSHWSGNRLVIIPAYNSEI
jgi:hypothetical protein